jgi:hypothetical protein
MTHQQVVSEPGSFVRWRESKNDRPHCHSSAIAPRYSSNDCQHHLTKYLDCINSKEESDFDSIRIIPLKVQS